MLYNLLRCNIKMIWNESCFMSVLAAVKTCWVLLQWSTYSTAQVCFLIVLTSAPVGVGELPPGSAECCSAPHSSRNQSIQKTASSVQVLSTTGSSGNNNNKVRVRFPVSISDKALARSWTTAAGLFTWNTFKVTRPLTLRQTGCSWLLNVNNRYIFSTSHGSFLELYLMDIDSVGSENNAAIRAVFIKYHDRVILIIVR